jgi:hypothetical protein
MKTSRQIILILIFFTTLTPYAFGQLQFSKDTLAVDGQKVAFISNVTIEEKTIINAQGREQTGPVTEYTITLFKPVTFSQKIDLAAQLNPLSVNYIQIDFKEDFNSSTTKENAGLLIIEAANLKNTRNSSFLASSLISASGTILQLSSEELGLSPNTTKAIPLVTLTASVLMTIRGIVLDYEANIKLRDAGVALQNQPILAK